MRYCKYFRSMFQVFHLTFLYVTSVASELLKSRLSVAHEMHVKKWEGVEAVPVQAKFGRANSCVGT
jgi:hypothetical protein